MKSINIEKSSCRTIIILDFLMQCALDYPNIYRYILNTFKYHISCTDGKISELIYCFTFIFHRRPI